MTAREWTGSPLPNLLDSLHQGFLTDVQIASKLESAGELHRCTMGVAVIVSGKARGTAMRRIAGTGWHNSTDD
jgi:hypothetical protein